MSADNLQLARLAVAGLTRKERVEFLRDLIPAKEPTAKEQTDRIIRRIEAARILARSTRGIDRLCVEGVLHKVTLPGRTRGAGFRLSDVQALLNGGHAP